MILEGLVTSRSASGAVNLAPMGPVFADDPTTFVLRPFQSSTTFRHLVETRVGVFHTTDDVLLLARCALEDWPLAAVPTEPAHRIAGHVLVDCGTWREFEVTAIDDRQPRSVLTARVVHQGRRRDLCGWNRAQFAVLEATILATRTHLISAAEREQQIERLAPLVEKTAGPREQEAWRYVLKRLSELSALSHETPAP